MGKYVLVKVIDREIYVYPYDNQNEAWDRVVTEFNEFCKENDILVGYDSSISYDTLSAWVNGSFECVDWQIHKID